MLSLKEEEVMLQVEQMWSGCKNPSLLDRFTLVFPYCLDLIKWDVMYNAMYPLVAPDVIFAPEDEGFHPYGGAEKSCKNSLADWNSRDPASLLSLIIELRDAYKEYQSRRIGEVDDDRLKFEISTMLPREGIEMYFKLPPWLDGGCTTEYLPNLEEMLESQIRDAVSAIETRRKFIMALAPHFGRPIEADLVFCRRASFLASSEVFTFLVYFSLSLQFPKQQPSVMFQSSQHFNSQGVPMKSLSLTEYPWSPRWESSQMAERLFTNLKITLAANHVVSSSLRSA